MIAKPKCMNHNTATQACMNIKCHLPNPFICENCENNQCKQRHQKCVERLDWGNMINKLSEPKKSQNFERITKTVQKVINQTIKIMEKQQCDFNEWKQIFGMPQDSIQLMNCIKNQKEQLFNGNRIAKIIQEIRTQQVYIFDQEKTNLAINSIYQQAQKLQIMIKNLYLRSKDIDRLKTEKVPRLNTPLTPPKPIAKIRPDFSKLQTVKINPPLYNADIVSLKMLELHYLRKQYSLIDLINKLSQVTPKIIHLELKWKAYGIISINKKKIHLYAILRHAIGSIHITQIEYLFFYH